MAAIILDTNIISCAHLQEPAEWLLQWLRNMPPESIAIPWTVIYETEYGIRCVERTNPAKAEYVLSWFEEFLERRMLLVDMTQTGARLLGQMAASPPLRNLFETQPRENKWGEPLKNDKVRLGVDAMVAAMAISHQIPVASFNVKDFLHINRYFPLPGLYDPREDEWHIAPPVGWGLTDNANDDEMIPDTKAIAALRR